MVHDTMSTKQRNALRVVRGLVASAVILFGMLKLIGVPMMVTVFDHVGFGQWFRYVTGLIEVVGAIMSHFTVVPGSPVPATVLLTLCAVIAWSYRNSTLALLGQAPTQRVSE